LVDLTFNKNETVACYASWALADKSYPDLKLIFYKFILKDRQVETFSGCIVLQSNISIELYDRYFDNVDDSKKPSDRILFQLDSIILYCQNPFYFLLKSALNNRVYQEPIKGRISYLAFDLGNKMAIFYLSKWHKAEYADKIKTTLVQYLNDTAFKPKDYFITVEELFTFNDPEVRKQIISKMKIDRRWEMNKERFNNLLKDNYIYNIDNE
jgi:hypothetical protein